MARSVTNEGEVYFALRGPHLDPDEVTAIVGLEPTSVIRRADPKRRLSVWKVSSGRVVNDYINVYDLSAELVSRLESFAAKLAFAKQQLNAEAVLEVVLWITTDETKSTPAIGFDSRVLAFAVAVGATIDIDTYRNAP